MGFLEVYALAITWIIANLYLLYPEILRTAIILAILTTLSSQDLMSSEFALQNFRNYFPSDDLTLSIISLTNNRVLARSFRLFILEVLKVDTIYPRRRRAIRYKNS